jgi:sarcosine oxidase subunit gamma
MSYKVKIVREDISALFDLKGEQDEMREYLKNCYGPIPLIPNTSNSTGTWKLMYVGPEHWILKAPIDDEEKLVSLLRPDNAPKSLSIVLISDTLTFFSLSGEDALDIMSIATSMDLHSDAFGNDNATFSEVFGLKALISREVHGYQFAVDQSFGNMVSDYLDRTLAN